MELDLKKIAKAITDSVLKLGEDLLVQAEETGIDAEEFGRDQTFNNEWLKDSPTTDTFTEEEKEESDEILNDEFSTFNNELDEGREALRKKKADNWAKYGGDGGDLTDEEKQAAQQRQADDEAKAQNPENAIDNFGINNPNNLTDEDKADEQPRPEGQEGGQPAQDGEGKPGEDGKPAEGEENPDEQPKPEGQEGEQPTQDTEGKPGEGGQPSESEQIPDEQSKPEGQEGGQPSEGGEGAKPAVNGQPSQDGEGLPGVNLKLPALKPPVLDNNETKGNPEIKKLQAEIKKIQEEIKKQLDPYEKQLKKLQKERRKKRVQLGLQIAKLTGYTIKLILYLVVALVIFIIGCIIAATIVGAVIGGPIIAFAGRTAAQALITYGREAALTGKQILKLTWDIAKLDFQIKMNQIKIKMIQSAGNKKIKKIQDKIIKLQRKEQLDQQEQEE